MRVWTYIPYPHLIFNLNQKDKMEVKFMRRLTESHIDALYEAMEERMMERMEALEKNKYNEEQQE